ncbi:MAG TPA: hypothetical protein VML94_06120 [Thermoplasmata archaeon]|nr:hypothetical protein [Thermoplasmata archaeon]
MGRRRPVVVAIEGISGAGKSTLVARAAAEFGWSPLAEAYDRLDPRPAIGVRTPPALARIERRLLDEERRRFENARALVRHGATVLADTGFLGPLTYTAGLAALGVVPRPMTTALLARTRRWARAGRWGAPDAIVYLATRAPTRRRRAKRDPARHPPALAVRHERVGLLEERFYATTVTRLLPGRLLRLDGERPIDRLVPALGRIVRRAVPLADRARTALRLLDGFAEFPSEERPPRAGAGNR